jgi:hypothetical protein
MRPIFTGTTVNNLNYKVLSNRRLFNGSFHSLTSNELDCFKQCLTNKSCVAATFKKNLECFFLGNDYNLEINNNFTSFIKNSSEFSSQYPNHFTIKSNLRLFKYYNKLENVSNELECFSLCQIEDKCVASSFNPYCNCFFYDKNYLVGHDPEWTSYFKIKPGRMNQNFFN